MSFSRKKRLYSSSKLFSSPNFIGQVPVQIEPMLNGDCALSKLPRRLNRETLCVYMCMCVCVCNFRCAQTSSSIYVRILCEQHTHTHLRVVRSDYV